MDRYLLVCRLFLLNKKHTNTCNHYHITKETKNNNKANFKSKLHSLGLAFASLFGSIPKLFWFTAPLLNQDSLHGTHCQRIPTNCIYISAARFKNVE